MEVDIRDFLLDFIAVKFEVKLHLIVLTDNNAYGSGGLANSLGGANCVASRML